MADPIIVSQIIKAEGLKEGTDAAKKRREQLMQLPNSELNSLLANSKTFDKKAGFIDESKKTTNVKNIWENKPVEKTNQGVEVEKSKPVKPEVKISEAQYKAVKLGLKAKYSAMKAELLKAEANNGYIGNAWDWVKNKTSMGASSDKVRASLESMKKQLDSLEKDPNNLSGVFKSITGQEMDKDGVNGFLKGKVKTSAEASLQNYKEGQEMVVDITADVVSGVAAVGIYTAAVAAAPFTGGTSIALGIVAAGASGAAIKSGIKYSDAKIGGREYDSLGSDLATGAFSGVLAPVTGGLGGAAGRTVATKMGLQAAKSFGKEFVEETVETTFKQSVKTALRNPAGYKYMGGNALKRGTAYAAEMVTDGAVSGSVDNSFRAGLKGEDVGSAFVDGLVGGALLSPVIGGGFKTLGHAGSSAGKKIINLTNKNMHFDVRNLTEMQISKYQAAVEAVAKTPEEKKLLNGVLKNSMSVVSREDEIALMKSQYTELRKILSDSDMDKVFVYIPQDKVGVDKSYRTSAELFMEVNGIDKSRVVVDLPDKSNRALINKGSGLTDLPKDAVILIPDDCSISGSSLLMDGPVTVSESIKNFKGKVVLLPTVAAHGAGKGKVYAKEVFDNVSDNAFLVDKIAGTKEAYQKRIKRFGENMKPEQVVYMPGYEITSYRNGEYYNSLSGTEKGMLDAMLGVSPNLRKGFNDDAMLLVGSAKAPNNNTGFGSVFAEQVYGVESKKYGILNPVNEFENPDFGIAAIVGPSKDGRKVTVLQNGDLNGTAQHVGAVRKQSQREKAELIDYVAVDENTRFEIPKKGRFTPEEAQQIISKLKQVELFDSTTDGFGTSGQTVKAGLGPKVRSQNTDKAQLVLPDGSVMIVSQSGNIEINGIPQMIRLSQEDFISNLGIMRPAGNSNSPVKVRLNEMPDLDIEYKYNKRAPGELYIECPEDIKKSLNCDYILASWTDDGKRSVINYKKGSRDAVSNGFMPETFTPMSSAEAKTFSSVIRVTPENEGNFAIRLKKQEELY